MFLTIYLPFVNHKQHPSIQGIVKSQFSPQLAAGIAQHRRHAAQHEGAPGLDEAGRGRHRGQARDGANTETHQSWWEDIWLYISKKVDG